MTTKFPITLAKVVLNQAESVALCELLRRADGRGTEIEVRRHENGKRELRVLVGDLASAIILQKTP